MIKIIKQLTVSLLLVSSFSLPVLAQTAPGVVDVISTQENERKNDPMNKVIQATKGCEAAMSVESWSNRLRGKDANLPTACNENIHEDYSEVDAEVRNLAYKYLGGMLFVFVCIGLLFKTIEKKSGKKTNIPKYAFLLCLTILITFPFVSYHTKSGRESKNSIHEIATMVGMKITSDEANDNIARMRATKLTYFSTVTLPDYDGLTAQFEVFINFLIAVNGINDDQPVTFYFSDKNGDILGKAASGKFVAELTLPIDENCVKLASEYKLFDCRQKQIDWYKQYTGEAIAKLNAIKNNYVVGFNNASSVFNKEFDMKVSCEGIESLDLTVYSQRDLNGMYLKKAASCVSQEFLYKMHKLKNITTEEYLTKKNYLKSRRVSLCAHDESGTFKNKGFTREESLKQVDTCVTEACGAQGSPYMCSAAVATFHSLQRKESTSWFLIPAYLIGDIGVNLSQNAEKFGRRFMFEYEEAENAQTVNNNAQTVFTLSYPKLKGYDVMEYSYWEKTRQWFSDQYQYYMGMAMDFNTDQLMQIANIGQDGFFGLPKLSTCISNPNKYVDGYLCGSILKETFANGAENIKAGISMFVISSAQLGTMKGVKNSSTAEIAQQRNILQKVINSKNAGIIGYFIATSNENNIYTNSTGSLETATVNSGLFIASALGGQEIRSLIKWVAIARITIGVFFYIILPGLLLSRFLVAVAEFIIHLAMALTMAPLVLVEAPLTSGSMSNTFSKREFGVPDFLITSFLLVTFSISLVLVYFFTDFFLNTLYAGMPVDLMTVAHYLTAGSISSGSVGTEIITNTIDSLVFAVLHTTILILSFSTISLVSIMRGWILFKNGSFSTDNEADNAHQQVMSKIKT